MTNWLDGAIPSVTAVYSSTPKIIPGTQFEAGVPPGTMTSAVIVVHFRESFDHRIAMGGQKEVTHNVVLYVRVHSRQPDSEDAMADADAIYDDLIAYLRTNKQLGSPTTIFLAGEDPNGDLRITTDAMQSDRGSLWQFSTVEVSVKEIVTA